MPDEKKSARIDWSAPSGGRDALFGSGATRSEKTLPIVVGALGAIVLVLAAHTADAGWTIGHDALAAIIALDIVGGVVANGLNSAKRDHFGPPPAGRRSRLSSIVNAPISFAALHVQPIVVGVLFPPHMWWWGLGWYLAVLAGVALVRTAPLYLERPVALSWCALVAMAAAYIPSPDLWGWLPVMLALKLVLAHAVQEAPYRPI
ncbi:hypothetical protein [Microbacterium sp. KNMS]